MADLFENISFMTFINCSEGLAKLKMLRLSIQCDLEDKPNNFQQVLDATYRNFEYLQTLPLKESLFSTKSRSHRSVIQVL